MLDNQNSTIVLNLQGETLFGRFPRPEIWKTCKNSQSAYLRKDLKEKQILLVPAICNLKFDIKTFLKFNFPEILLFG